MDAVGAEPRGEPRRRPRSAAPRHARRRFRAAARRRAWASASAASRTSTLATSPAPSAAARRGGEVRCRPRSGRGVRRYRRGSDMDLALMPACGQIGRGSDAAERRLDARELAAGAGCRAAYRRAPAAASANERSRCMHARLQPQRALGQIGEFARQFREHRDRRRTVPAGRAARDGARSAPAPASIRLR